MCVALQTHTRTHTLSLSCYFPPSPFSWCVTHAPDAPVKILSCLPTSHTPRTRISHTHTHTQASSPPYPHPTTCTPLSGSFCASSPLPSCPHRPSAGIMCLVPRREQERASPPPLYSPPVCRAYYPQLGGSRRVRVINETQRNEERTPECTSGHPARVHSFGNPELFARSRARAWGLCPFAKAPPVDFFAWLPVGVNYNKPARGSVSLI